MSAIKPVRFDKYLLLDRIAFGGMAEVFRAKLIGAKGFEKPVVLKKMLPHLTDEEDMVNHFIDEARLAALLKHENIIHIYDFGVVSNSFFIAMEYLFGKDLHLIIQKAIELDQSINLENILFIIAKVCEGLAYAHKLKDLEGNPLNIIHRDISPHNIFITYDGQVKLIDFGIAKAATQSTKTQTGIIKGKVAYMSPEQASGKHIDHRSDIFAVGIVLYELVTKTKMFEGDTFKVLAQVIEAQYESPEKIILDLPDKLCEIIHKALQKDPNNRYQSSEEMGADVEDCLYDLKYRPHTKKLSAYVTSLFEGQYDDEKKQMSQTMKYQISEASELNSDLAKKPYQPTEVFDTSSEVKINNDDKTEIDTPVPRRQTEAIHLGDENTFKKSVIAFIANCIQSKKQILVFSGIWIVFFIISGITIGYLLKYDENAVKIDHMLKSAEKSMNNNRILFPEKDCVLYYYQETLKIDSNNKKAKAGLKHVVSTCILQAKNEVKKKELNSAKKYIEVGLSIDPKNEQLQAMKQKTSTTAIRITHLLEAAKKSKDEKRIISPKNDCALYYYQEVLKIDSNNEEAKVGMQNVVSVCISQAEIEMKKMNLKSARKYVRIGLEIDPENKQLLSMKRKTASGSNLIINNVKSIFKKRKK